MKKSKNRLDEMQEQKMLRIEHNGCWIAFWGLSAAVLGQLIYYGPNCANQVMGELAVFLCLAFYIVIGCVRNGIWDRKFAPSWKTNLVASLIAGIVSGIIRFCIVYREYHTALSCVYIGIMVGISAFAGCFVLMSGALLIYKWRENRLEEGEADEREDK